MEFDFTLLLVALPLAFVLGWLASRMDLRQLRIENQQAPKAYFKGLNFLLNEQQDQAIDAFIEAVQNDPDTSELHFALGNLFRRRGEYERAVRVHQHLLSRGDLSADDRHRAQYALALDYLKAGLLDRAEDALRKLEGTRFATQAFLALLANYERARDWEHAAEVARKLEASGQGSFKSRQAHYLCEQAASLLAAGDSAGALALLQQARNMAPDAPRPYMDWAALQQQLGQPQAAYAALTEALSAAPAAMGLIAPALAAVAPSTGHTAAALHTLQAAYAQTYSLDVLDAVVALQSAQDAQDAQDAQTAEHAGDTSAQTPPPPREWYARHLAHEPSLVAAARWLADETLGPPQFQPHLQRALEHAVKPLTRYRCAACGFEAKRHFWQCPGCQTWDSYPARRVEEL